MKYILFSTINLSSFDWSTIIGSIITGLITWLAVYKTAEFDKKSRINEFKYSYYISKLINFGQELEVIKKIIDYFEPSDTNKVISNDKLYCDFELISFKKDYNCLCKINNEFALKTKNFSENFEIFQNLIAYFQHQIDDHRFFLKSHDEKFKKDFVIQYRNDTIRYNVNQFLKQYNKQYPNQVYDEQNMQKSIIELNIYIEEEFRLN